MKTKNLFFAAIISVVAPIFLTSCMNEEKGELDKMSFEYNQKKQISMNKQIDTHVEVAEDVADLFDIKATYVLDGKTIVENLRDMNHRGFNTNLTSEGRVIIYNTQNYGFSKYIGKSAISLTITATPKIDAFDKVQNMPDDKSFCFAFMSKTTCNGFTSFLGTSGYNKDECKTMSKNELMIRLEMGEFFLEKYHCER